MNLGGELDKVAALINEAKSGMRNAKFEGNNKCTRLDSIYKDLQRLQQEGGGRSVATSPEKEELLQKIKEAESLRDQAQNRLRKYTKKMAKVQEG